MYKPRNGGQLLRGLGWCHRKRTTITWRKKTVGREGGKSVRCQQVRWITLVDRGWTSRE